ncbi:adenosine deaminase [Streptomyces sp. CB03234]|uniref:adenosine deaminase family protein n=1 Tax=Streptomyces sp. (strain CB03234) TaxID=1703937 RepID=UPI00093A7F3C|nr:adenosine deaminase [Streptomyces sp. CB03234]OKK03762.1 adenosine deaminase [Streptomyces sp. CB03234]
MTSVRAAWPAVAVLLAAVLPVLPGAVPDAAAAHEEAGQREVTAAERRVARELAGLRDRPDARRAFFRALPKGGDLHNHLFGAASTEFLIELAGRDGLCVDTRSMTAVRPPCGPGTRPAAHARVDADFRRRIVRAWSMQDFPPDRPGHDHFFATFGRFAEVARRGHGRVLAEVADSVARQNQVHLETMVTPVVGEAERLADEVGFDPDLGRLHGRLLAGGRMDRLVALARAEADAGDAQFRSAARCGTARPGPGCGLSVRFISQAYRESAPERVFTQLVLGMELAERDERFVAVNLVQPEDGERALRDYHLHMSMLDLLHRRYPRARITLHAGELVPGLVKPHELTFHITEAVRTGRAERIGHGVSVRHEAGRERLLRTMAEREIAVETPLTSNDQILGVRGAEHPFMTYRRHGVPVVLATDDPGVSRTDISREYERAALTYGLGYPELKDLARASLQHAFLPGRSLWRTVTGPHAYTPVRVCRHERPGGHAPGPGCAGFLRASPRAAVQWRQEMAFAAFERR